MGGHASVALRTRRSSEANAAPKTPKHLARLMAMIEAEQLPRFLVGREYWIAQTAYEIGQSVGHEGHEGDVEYVIAAAIREKFRDPTFPHSVWKRILDVIWKTQKWCARTDVQSRYRELYPPGYAERVPYVGEHLDQMVNERLLRRDPTGAFPSYYPTYYVAFALDMDSEPR